MNRFLIVLMTLSSANVAAEALAHHRWQHRLLLIFADEQHVPVTEKLRADLGEARCELEDRDLVIGWFIADAPATIGVEEVDGETARSIRETLRVVDGKMTVVLVGKDGGVKSRYADIPRLDTLFALIDGMPMRRTEARKRGDGCGN